MRKFVFTLLLAFATTASAQTLTPYGKLDVGYSHVQNSNGASPRGEATDMIESGSLSGSRIGLRLEEPLTHGFKVVGVVEGGISVDTSDFKLVNRQANAGLSNKQYGTLTVGRHQTSQYYLQAAIDPFEVGTVGDMGTLVRRQSRVDNAVQYTSPTYYNLTATALYTVDRAGTESPGNDLDTPGFVLGLTYKEGPVLVGATLYHDKVSATGTESNVGFVGGTWACQHVKLHGAVGFYNVSGDADVDQLSFMVGASRQLFAGTLRGSVTALRERDQADSDALKVAFGYFFPWSARTDLYAVVAHIENERFSARTFDNTDTVSQTAGTDGISVGLRHTF